MEQKKDRKTLKSLSSPYTAKKVFGDIPTSSWVCHSCVQLLRHKTVNAKGQKRRWPGPRTPRRLHNQNVGPSPKRLDQRQTPSKVYLADSVPSPKRLVPSSTHCTESVSHGAERVLSFMDKENLHQDVKNIPLFKKTVINYIHGSHYLKAFKLLWEESEAARNAMVTCTLQHMQEELQVVTRQKCRDKQMKSLARQLSTTNLDSSFWHDVTSEAQEKVPILYSVIHAAFPTAEKLTKGKMVGPKGGKRSMSVSQGNDIKLGRIGMVLAMILHSHTPHRYKFLQQALAVHLWQQGASHKLYETLSRLGMSLTPTSARRQVDILTRDHDQTVTKWKSDIEVTYQQQAPEQQVNNPRRRLLYDESQENTTDRSFSLGWDNVQQEVHRKHATKDKGNQMISLGLTFAVGHRLPSMQLHSNHIRAVEIPISTFLPSLSDWRQVKEVMVIIVQRVLVNHVPALKDLQPSISKHKIHEHWKEMQKQSVVINLGTVDANPSSTAGTIDIMSHLQNYCPHKPDGSLVPIVTNGDQMSVERMTHAKRASIQGDTDQYRLEGLEESIQDFHKEGILLQDTMDEFFTQRSISDRGTLYHLKEFFNHRSLKGKVMENFQHVWDFIEFVTEGLVLILFMKFAQMDDIGDVPRNLWGAKGRKCRWLQRMAYRVVDYVFMPYNQEDVLTAGDCGAMGHRGGRRARRIPDPYPYCTCKEEKGGNMTQCCSSLCERQWFHWECVYPPLQEEPQGLWYCSESCRNNEGLAYCVCQTKRGRQDQNMVECSAGDSCQHKQLYHAKCVDIDPNAIPDNWYCSDECHEQGTTDHILEHSRSLLWRGLQHLANRDAVREGNGPLIVLFWKINLPEFWNRKHPKYVIAAHRLLANINGFQDARIAHDLVWERVCNLTGQPANNVPLDLANELLNNEFKELLRHSRGNYTPEQIERCSKMGGAFGQNFSRAFRSAMNMKEHVTQHKKAHHYKSDIQKFVTSFLGDELFHHRPLREHDGFKGYVCVTNIKKAPELGAHLHKLNDQLDFWRRRAERARLLAREDGDDEQ